jgi:hypothetical protein
MMEAQTTPHRLHVNVGLESFHFLSTQGWAGHFVAAFAMRQKMVFPLSSSATPMASISLNTSTT